jgi:ADP-sugar diphosphatase
MPTFTLPGTSPPVPIKLTSDISEEQLLSFPAFSTWHSTLQKSLDQQRNSTHPFHSHPYLLRGIEVQSCDYFGTKRLGFIKLKADVSNDNGEWLPGAVFLRGGSVAMLLIVQPYDANDRDEEYVILAVQPRVAAGSLRFVELPAGMLDDSGTFSGAAAKEIKEETGLEIKESELVDMTKLVFQSRNANQQNDELHLQQATYPSPGACDEFIPLFLARKKMTRGEIKGMREKLTGLRDEGEKITLKLCRLDELWKVGARDGKTLAALALYEGLKREGKV